LGIGVEVIDYDRARVSLKVWVMVSIRVGVRVNVTYY
jgi:hypothetical protein